MTRSDPPPPRGTLMRSLLERGRRALASGALEPIATRVELIEDGGVCFVVRVLDTTERKRLAGLAAPGNPFLPYDEAMFVADLSETHVALLNKFRVIERHLLLVTREFEEQRSPLTLADFEALERAMTEIDGLGFYNGGGLAGASQSHKHLQLVGLPLAPRGPALPVAKLLDHATPTPGALPGLPFRHSAARRGEPGASAALELYRRLLDALDARDLPYNLLVTRGSMLVVPRGRERFESVSVNALGFAGSLFVRDDAELDLVRRKGPMAVLAAVVEESR